MSTEYTTEEMVQHHLDAFYDCVGGGTREELGLGLMCLGLDEQQAELTIREVCSRLAWGHLMSAGEVIEYGCGVASSLKSAFSLLEAMGLGHHVPLSGNETY